MSVAPSAGANSVTLPSPPFITVSGIPNFRDLGGYPTLNPANHTIKRGVIYRCAEPSQVTEAGIRTIQALGITHVYDLRSNNEIERGVAAGRGGIVEWEGCKRVFAPVFLDKDYSPENLAVRYKDYAAGGEVNRRTFLIRLNCSPLRFQKLCPLLIVMLGIYTCLHRHLASCAAVL